MSSEEQEIAADYLLSKAAEVQGKPHCQEEDLRKELDDDEFWDHVFNSLYEQEQDEQEEPDIYELEEMGLEVRKPCPLCNATSACGYDDEDRPWIHAIHDEDL